MKHPSIALDPIPGHPEYMASRLGGIFSVKTWNKLARPLKQSLDKDGYPVVGLSHGKKMHTRKVHRLILETYVGPCPPGMQCLHGPGGKLNNSIENLRWGTHLENQAEKAEAGSVKGEKNGKAKLRNKDIKEILITNTGEAARKFKVNRSTIIRIKRGESYKNAR